MLFTLTNNVPVNIEDLMTTAGYVATQRPVDSNVTVKISHKLTAATNVYYEGCGVELAPGVYVNSTDSDYLEYGDYIEFSCEYFRLKTIRLLACCSDTDIYITLL